MSKLLPAAREFQSDARQIDEQRPPWIARAVLYLLVALIACAIGWASIAKSIGSWSRKASWSPLRLRLSCSRLRPLWCAASSHKSARASTRDALATLDPTSSKADAAQPRDKIASFDAQIARLEAEIADKPYAPELIDDEVRLQLAIWTRRIEKQPRNRS